ncbi:MAG: efflux transporter, family, subunit [Cytophagaceae bacterium]|jgi:membrane fusion protein (multidrug efflux system)|nr:efflux transporter, family, subunit [Cytophagaceae bacterium]
MKAIKIGAIVLIILGILIFIKWKFFAGTAENGKSAKPGIKAASPVTIYVAKNQTFNEKIVSTGTALANEEASLTPEVAGKVIRIYFSEGTLVKKNTLLVKINDADLKAQLDKVELQIQLSEQKLQRQKQLLEINGVSQEGFDIAANEVSGFKSDRDFLTAQIRKTEIRAPFDGVIGLRNISEGSYVTPSTIVASILQLTPMKIDFSVPEKYASMVHAGDLANVQTEGTSVVFKAKVFAIEPKIDLATRTLKIRALCYDHKHKLLPGAFVKVDMIKQSTTSILIPTEALIAELKGYKVFFYRNGKAISGTVKAGTRTDTQVLITEGIAEGDTIVTSGMMQLKNESPIIIKGTGK